MRTWLANSEGLPTPELEKCQKLLAFEQKVQQKGPGSKPACSPAPGLLPHLSQHRGPGEGTLSLRFTPWERTQTASYPHCMERGLMKTAGFVLR